MDQKIKEQLTQFGAHDAALEKLALYADLLRRWNKTINLVAPSTLDMVWQRHLIDSAQLAPLITGLPGKSLVDLGSGGGLPGLVLAMLTEKQVTLIESDTRKCVFLREVSRETGLKNVTIVNKRIEEAGQTGQIKADIVTARALAPLEQLIAWSLSFIGEKGVFVFMKGQGVEAELAVLSPKWQEKFSLIPSKTDMAAQIAVARVSRET